MPFPPWNTVRYAGRGAAALLLIVCAAPAVPAIAQSQPRAEPNEQRTPAGRLIEGELRVDLEAVEAAWYPRGPDGPRVVTPAFAEVGGPPRVPGPLIRAPAGTPVAVTIRNALDRPIAVRGLIDRASMSPVGPPPGVTPLPDFELEEGRATALRIVRATGERTHLPARER